MKRWKWWRKQCRLVLFVMKVNLVITVERVQDRINSFYPVEFLLTTGSELTDCEHCSRQQKVTPSGTSSCSLPANIVHEYEEMSNTTTLKRAHSNIFILRPRTTSSWRLLRYKKIENIPSKQFNPRQSTDDPLLSKFLRFMPYSGWFDHGDEEKYWES